MVLLLDNRLYLINLYDYYGDVLTKKQQVYFEYYYFENLSLSEIAENENISKAAVFKHIKEAEAKLISLENVLKDYSKTLRIKEAIKDLDLDIKNKILRILEE